MRLNCCRNTIFPGQKWVSIRLREAQPALAPTAALGWQPTAFTFTSSGLLRAFALPSLLLCQALALLSRLFGPLSKNPGEKP